MTSSRLPSYVVLSENNVLWREIWEISISNTHWLARCDSGFWDILHIVLGNLFKDSFLWDPESGYIWVQDVSPPKTKFFKVIGIPAWSGNRGLVFGGKILLNSCLNLILEKTDFSTSYISIGPAGLIYFQRKSNFFSHQNKYSLASSKCYS